MNKHTLHHGVAGTGVAGLLLSLLAASGGGTLSFLAGCGGSPGTGSGSGGSSSVHSAASSSSTTSSGQGGGDPRAMAAMTAATTDPLCTNLKTAFYWEIGDKTGTKASGQGNVDAGTVDPNKSMVLASASKWIFGAYVLEKQSLDTIVAAGNDIYLNFTSPYYNLDNLQCTSLLADTVDQCFTNKGNDTQTPNPNKQFCYNGGHLQAYAVNFAGLGNDYRTMLSMQKTPELAADVQGAIGNIMLGYSNPMLAGGGDAQPSEYAAFLRQILNGKLVIAQHLGDRAVCAWTHQPDCNAIYSPVNETKPGVPTNDVSDEKWHYSIAHWVEKDGTFSSPGADGFYPWIDASKTYYGILARYAPSSQTAGEEGGPAYYESVQCGRQIRNAWLNTPP